MADYHSGGRGGIVAQKLRFQDKAFAWEGDAKAAALFGSQVHKPSPKISITITEGEIDCLSAAQAFDLKYPVVSLKNGASQAVKEIRENVEYLSGFKDVVLMFDSDDPGRKASQAVCEALGAHLSFRVADLGPTYKDANEALLDGNPKTITDAFFQAKPYRPDGLKNAYDLKSWWISLPDVKSWPYPWPSLNTVTHGIRKGELVTITAGTGIGKSAFIKEIAYSLEKSGEKVGILSMEENVRKTLDGLVGLELGKRLDLNKEALSEQERAEGFDAVFRRGGYTLYDHFGSIDIDRLLSIVKFMAVQENCGWIFLDHISIVISGMDTKVDERRELDRAMTALRSFVEASGIGLVVVSHLKRPDGSKGFEEGREVNLSHLRSSQAIAQLSDMVLALERDKSDEEKRDRTSVRVLKNRFSGEDGMVACELLWDKETGRMSEDLSVTEAPF